MALKHVDGRVIVQADKEQKNNFTFSNGFVIRIERDYNNLDRSYTQQTFGVVISSEDIPTDALILFHFNALNETNKINNHSGLSGKQIATGIEVYSIPVNQCYLWKMAGEEKWNPCGDYEIAERVFIPYKGILHGIEPKKLKDTLFVKTGQYKGLVVKTDISCDAVIHFRNEKGVDESLIRFRPNGSKEEKREPEALAILNDITDKVKSGEYLVGIEIKDAKPINELV
jgi:hypothetical protein